MLRSLFCILSALCLPHFFSSCVNPKSVLYFNDIKDSTVLIDPQSFEPLIQKNDLLSITVSSPNPELTQMFNTQGSTSSQSAGYLVNEEGIIQFPMLGPIHAAGITKKKLQETIARALTEKKLVMSPIVDIRLSSYKIYILGEVAHPNAITVPTEKINIMQAISMAGDLTLSAKRDNVMLIREEDGHKLIKRLDLSSTELLNSPYYYLRSNDIIYVEPNKAKIAAAGKFNRLFPYVISVLSLTFVIVDRFIK